MPTDEQVPSTGARRPTGTGDRSWFGANGSGAGGRPQTRQGWVLIRARGAALSTIVALLRTGLV
jgi:hypothetical protein